ncbi:hypothetical protein RHGRI_008857 [Rhododendron griersonianum]|uniref:SH3 domain-containing protein n=1 Tax=Rhododendron griersonianum TaxID=479676 RepID=A0AAV6L3P3_9ERIC|nr:hypothetical protein RHGRI_008857 [Rhododendron griersonianum]
MAGRGVGFDAGGVEDLRGQVAAEETPGGSVGGGADTVLVAGGDLAGGEGLGAVGKDGAILDEGLVGQGGGADEDGRAGPDTEGEDWAVFRPEGTEGGWVFGEWCAEEPKEVADYRNGGGSGREFLLVGNVEDGFDYS